MTNNYISKTVTALAIAALAVGSVPAFAQTGSATSTAAHTKAETQFLTKAVQRADQEIARRTQGLNDLISRISDIARLSASDKTNLTTGIQSQISTLAALKTKIDTETDVAAMRTDIKSIADSYRIFALVMPQVRIVAAADRAITVADMMAGVGSKLQARIAAAQSAGQNVTTLTTTLTDLASKLSDAKSQASAAVSEVGALVPDNGDQAKFQANKQALSDARTKIQAAQKDLSAARKDVSTIMKALKSMKLAPNASASSTAPH